MALQVFPLTVPGMLTPPLQFSLVQLSRLLTGNLVALILQQLSKCILTSQSRSLRKKALFFKHPQK